MTSLELSYMGIKFDVLVETYVMPLSGIAEENELSIISIGWGGS